MRFQFFVAVICTSLNLFSMKTSVEKTWNHQPAKQIADFKSAFLKNHYLRVIPSKQPRIPKIIHHIWLGSPVPEKYKTYINSWKKFHPDWEHRLWTNDDLISFPLVTGKKIYQSKNYGQRSDIFRMEILNRYGGLYVDTDYLCLKPHDRIHHTCDLYIGMVSKTEVSNSFIGSCPGHPLLLKYLNVLSNVKKFFPGYSQIMRQSGPRLITRLLHHQLKESDDGIMVFPTSYYYPFPGKLRHKFWKTQDLSIVKPYIKPHSHGVHLFATSWQR